MSQNLIGYNGKIAYIDLSTQTVEIKDLEPQLAKEYLGGTGLSAKLTYDLLSDEDFFLKGDLFSIIQNLHLSGQILEIRQI